MICHLSHQLHFSCVIETLYICIISLWEIISHSLRCLRHPRRKGGQKFGKLHIRNLKRNPSGSRVRGICSFFGTLFGWIFISSSFVLIIIRREGEIVRPLIPRPTSVGLTRRRKDKLWNDNGRGLFGNDDHILLLVGRVWWTRRRKCPRNTRIIHCFPPLIKFHVGRHRFYRRRKVVSAWNKIKKSNSPFSPKSHFLSLAFEASKIVQKLINHLCCFMDPTFSGLFPFLKPNYSLRSIISVTFL